ncbi:MAG: DUF4328 domain-containing protein [Pseudomonadota bacterium]
MRPIETLGKWALRVTGLIMLAEVLLLGVAAYTLVRLYDLRPVLPGSNTDSVAFQVVERYDISLGVYAIVLISGYIFNAFWIYRAVANAGTIRPDSTRIGPGWAIGFHFIPILNFWKPYTAMRQTWNTSTRADRDMDAPAPLFLKLWWATWLISTALGTASGYYYETYSLDGYIASTITDILNGVSSLICSFLFYRIIRDVTQAQTHATIDEVFR